MPEVNLSGLSTAGRLRASIMDREGMNIHEAVSDRLI